MKPIYLDLSGVAEATSLSTRQIERLSVIGEFPKARQLSAKRVAWLVSEVEAWCESRPVSSVLPVGKS
ncbi:UNVERIFIED_ORG: prophage regulatory protein [Burkholderia sp. 1263]